MKILQVASEAFPLVKTGGLADAVGALTAALARRGHDVHLLLPCYRETMRAALSSDEPSIDLGDPLGFGPARLRRASLPDCDATVWLLDQPALFDRPGGPYLDADGHDHPDNHLRFGALSRVAATIATFGPLLGWTPDIVHAHDWPTGLVPAYQRAFGGTTAPCVFTVHNLHFAGAFDASALEVLGLPASMFAIEGLEAYGAASALKAGLYYADGLSTVSPTYAREIQTVVGGRGLHGLLAHRSEVLRGIVNGIDDTVWHPATDPHLPARYDARDLRGKSVCAAALRSRFSLGEGGHVLGVVSRLSDQKGIDLLLDAWPQLATTLDLRLCVLGSGDPALEARLATAAHDHPDTIGFIRGYDEPLSHLVIAGADALCVPSRFEPCGLTQLYAMRYGTLPVVRRTGGLADTVADADSMPDSGTGICFDDPDPSALAEALSRASALLDDPSRHLAVIRRGMQQPLGWDHTVAQYERLYADTITRAR
jgi:starch synthase